MKYDKDDLEELDEILRANTRKNKHRKEKFEDDDVELRPSKRKDREKRNRKINDTDRSLQ